MSYRTVIFTYLLTYLLLLSVPWLIDKCADMYSPLLPAVTFLLETKYQLSTLTDLLIMVALCNREDHYIFAL